MTTMIDRKPPTATGGPSSTPIVTVSMHGNEPDVPSIEHVEVLPTIDADDAARVYNDTAERMTAEFAKVGVSPVHAPIRADNTGYRRVSFTTDSGTIVSLEKF